MKTKEVNIKLNFNDTKIEESYILEDRQTQTEGIAYASVVVPEDFQISKAFIKRCENLALAQNQPEEVLLRAYLGLRWGEVFKQASRKIKFPTTSHSKVVRTLNKLANRDLDGQIQDFSLETYSRKTAPCESI